MNKVLKKLKDELCKIDMEHCFTDEQLLKQIYLSDSNCIYDILETLIDMEF